MPAEVAASGVAPVPAGRVATLARAFEALQPATLEALLAFYAEDARFKDPFNEVEGRAAIGAIFRHMFAALEAPRFVVHEQVAAGAQAFLAWEMHYRLRRLVRAPMVIRGASHLRFDDAGLVTEHRDYWDAAEEFYAKLPFVGGLMRWLARQGAAT
ncbi:nuclear transport factor 2 family protein [Parapedomonas caeni]